MPEAILKFHLPKEEYEFQLSINGRKYYAVIKDFENFLRSKYKYSELSENEMTLIQSIRNELYAIADRYEANLDLG
jgi:hypothetical protein